MASPALRRTARAFSRCKVKARVCCSRSVKTETHSPVRPATARASSFQVEVAAGATASACFSDKRDKLQPFSGARGFGVVVGTLASFVVCRRPAAILSRASDRPDAQPRRDGPSAGRKHLLGVDQALAARHLLRPHHVQAWAGATRVFSSGGGQPLMPRSRRWCEDDCAASSCRHHKAFHQDALKSYDLAVLQCLESCCTGALTPEPCLQATLSTKSGGLGLRSIFRHSGAAYTASVLATSPILPTSTSRCSLPTMLLSHRRIPFDNKICLGQWIEARPPSLPWPSLGPAMKLLERISNFFKNLEQVLGCRPCQVLPLASMLTASSSASSPPSSPFWRRCTLPFLWRGMWYLRRPLSGLRGWGDPTGVYKLWPGGAMTEQGRRVPGRGPFARTVKVHAAGPFQVEGAQGWWLRPPWAPRSRSASEVDAAVLVADGEAPNVPAAAASKWAVALPGLAMEPHGWSCWGPGWVDGDPCAQSGAEKHPAQGDRQKRDDQEEPLRVPPPRLRQTAAPPKEGEGEGAPRRTRKPRRTKPVAPRAMGTPGAAAGWLALAGAVTSGR